MQKEKVVLFWFRRDIRLEDNMGLWEALRSGFPVLPVFIFDSDILDGLEEYRRVREIPYLDGTSNLSAHLRFGTVSVRSVVRRMIGNVEFVNELVWREFFMQIMYLFPDTVGSNFNRRYDFLEWRNNEAEFELWKRGETGFPLVDAGMRELNATGYMHNRVRMIVASFLCKDLLIDWRWGESYFAEKLMDYELSSNNGNWQWAAGTGCDAAPYFRVFNPDTQLKKFDPHLMYVRKWVPEMGSERYAARMVDHNVARIRALEARSEERRVGKECRSRWS